MLTHIFIITRQYDYRRWTPWEKVEVDIVGDHLIPVVVNKRLYIYWPEFREEPDEDKNNNVNIPSEGQSGSQLPKTYKRAKLRLAGSEYRNKKWTPKKVSKEYFRSYFYTGELKKKDIKFYPVDKSHIDGRVGIKFSGPHNLSGAFELFGCEGVPVKSQFSEIFNQVIWPEQSEVKYLDHVERPLRTDAPENDFTLNLDYYFNSGIWEVLRNVELLKQTPNHFTSYFAWHLSFFDKLFLGTENLNTPNFFLNDLVEQSMNDKRIKIPVGSWLPFFYADKTKTFIAFTMIDLSSLLKGKRSLMGGKLNNRAYYPEIKSTVKTFLSNIEGYLRDVLNDIDINTLSETEMLQIANELAVRLGESQVQTISVATLNEMFVRFFLRIFRLYVGIFSLATFYFRRYHFKNFYHPFMCDFIKLVYNPTQGIPALMSRKTQLKDSGFNFKRKYDPTYWVYDYNIGEEYPKEIVDFSPDGSYSPYNWELFYHTPLMIANSLSKNQRFEEAMEWYHYIFNPIGVEGTFPDGSDAGSPQKYWITKPFFLTTDEDYNKQRIDTILRMIAGDTTTDNFSSQLKADLEAQVKDWRYYPFEPHRIAQYRNVAYQKTVFMKYLDNLIAWGDHLFRQDSMEYINEATQFIF